MKTTLTLLIASTALTAAVGVPAWSAMRAPEGRDAGAFTAVVAEGAQAPLLLLASDHDDDGEGHDDHDRARRGHDDDHDDDEEDDDEEDDDENRWGGARNPAPAGTVAPPSNGLFGNGVLPKVQLN